MKTNAVIVYSLAWLACLVNVERNLTEMQIGEITNDVIDEYGYLKVEEVKYILKKGAKTEKIFGRLDYNVVMGWIKDYATERTELCIDISNQEEAQETNTYTPSDEAIGFDAYLDNVRERAERGDDEAAKILAVFESTSSLSANQLTKEAARRKEVDFKRYFYNEYLRNKKNKP